MNLGLVKPTSDSERRVALTPAAVASLAKSGISVLVERGSGELAGWADHEYAEQGARVVDRAEAFAQSELICCTTLDGALAREARAGQTLVGVAHALASPQTTDALAEAGVRSFALELMPRITRAQAMDVLSSQATVAGYKAALLAADHAPRMFPLMMTAAGTVRPARAFVIGAGVAGLQAIATSRKLGAVVRGYDVRPSVKEQVESLGAAFVELKLETSEAEAKSGYARAMDESFYRRQREAMAKIVAETDVVITTAAVPGKKPPLLITTEMVDAMPRGAVIVDLAARQGAEGGNCELTRPDETIHHDGVTIFGPTNLPSQVPHTASHLFARNMAAFIQILVKDGQFAIDVNDEIIRATLLTQDGRLVNDRVQDSISQSGGTA